MKIVEFNEEQLHNLDAIGKELFCDEQDPRSRSYIRKLTRPAINWFRICLCVFIPVIVLAILAGVLIYMGISPAVCIISAGAILLTYIILNLKRALICSVKIYQRYAPASVRNKCRFEPSCSEYMILSVEKYGLMKGFHKGIRRIRRCNIYGGGFDYP